MSEFKVKRATVDDAAGILNCGMRAFSTNAMLERTYPKSRRHLTSDEDLRAWRMYTMRRRITSDTNMYFKVVDPGDGATIIAYAAWSPPGTFANKSLKALTNPGPSGSNDEQTLLPPDAMDVQAQTDFLEEFDKVREVIWHGDSKYWYLGGLGVDPRFQKRGIARQLLQFGLDKAKEDGVPIYLEGTPDGLPIYNKLGFKCIHVSSFWDDTYQVSHCVLRPAETPHSIEEPH